MSGSFSEYCASAVLGHVVGKTAFTEPTTYLALCTTLPTSASTGSTIVEATYTGYARIATSGDWGSPTSATPCTIFNSSAITFAACTGSTSTIVGFALVDNSTTGAGNVLAWGSCSSTVISTTQTPATFAINALELTLTAS
jgi:hypothetical protein